KGYNSGRSIARLPGQGGLGTFVQGSWTKGSGRSLSSNKQSRGVLGTRIRQENWSLARRKEDFPATAPTGIAALIDKRSQPRSDRLLQERGLGRCATSKV